MTDDDLSRAIIEHVIRQHIGKSPRRATDEIIEQLRRARLRIAPILPAVPWGNDETD